MDNRAQRIKSIVTHLVNRPGEADQLTRATVETMYAEHGVEVSSRQIRRDIEEARSLAADRLQSPALPHWSEDIAGFDLRSTIAEVLRSDKYATISQLRQAVAVAHGRAIGDGELKMIAREVYRRMYIDPRVAKAKKTLREEEGTSWMAHRARMNADPLNYANPFGADPEAIRLRTLAWCNQLLAQLTGHGANRIVPSNANAVLRTLRIMLDLADGPDDAEASDAGGVTVSRLDQVHYG